MLAQTTRAFGVPTTLTSCCISRPTGRVATPAPCAATPSSAPDALPPWPSSSGSSGLLKRPVRPEPPEPSSSSAAGDSGTKASGGGRSGGSRRSNHRRTGTQRPSRASPAPVSQRCMNVNSSCCTCWCFQHGFSLALHSTYALSLQPITCHCSKQAAMMVHRPAAAAAHLQEVCKGTPAQGALMSLTACRKPPWLADTLVPMPHVSCPGAPRP